MGKFCDCVECKGTGWACDRYLWNSKLLWAACKWRSKALIFGHFARVKREGHALWYENGSENGAPITPESCENCNLACGGPCYYSSAQRARNDAILRSARKWSAARVRIPCDRLDQNLIESLQQPWHLHNQCARPGWVAKWNSTRDPIEREQTLSNFSSPRGANCQFCFIPRWAARLSPFRHRREGEIVSAVMRVRHAERNLLS